MYENICISDFPKSLALFVIKRKSKDDNHLMLVITVHMLHIYVYCIWGVPPLYLIINSFISTLPLSLLICLSFTYLFIYLSFFLSFFFTCTPRPYLQISSILSIQYNRHKLSKIRPTNKDTNINNKINTNITNAHRQFS